MTPDLHRPAKDDDQSVIVFHETPAGVAPAVRGWFYAGEQTGFLLRYSQKQLSTFSAATRNVMLPLAGISLTVPASDASELETR